MLRENQIDILVLFRAVEYIHSVIIIINILVSTFTITLTDMIKKFFKLRMAELLVREVVQDRTNTMPISAAKPKWTTA